MKRVTVLLLTLSLCLSIIQLAKGDEDFFDVIIVKYPNGEGLFSMRVDTMWVGLDVKREVAWVLHRTPDVIQLRDQKGTIMEDHKNIMAYDFENKYSYSAIYVEISEE